MAEIKIAGLPKEAVETQREMQRVMEPFVFEKWTPTTQEFIHANLQVVLEAGFRNGEFEPPAGIELDFNQSTGSLKVTISVGEKGEGEV